jgi:2-dehydropantoate 2-reductase
MGRYIIIGAGAVGGTIGARLFEAGYDVTLTARGEHLRMLQERGLRFSTPDGGRTLPIPAVEGPADVQPQDGDVLVFSMKTQDTAAALDAWVGRWSAAGQEPAIVLAQNGVENERLALRRARRVYGMCVWLPSTHLEPGVVVAQGVPVSGILHVGCYPSGTDDAVRRIAQDLEKAGFLAPVRADVMRWKYAKLLGNLTNAVEALCGPLDGPAATELMRRTMAEGAAVLEAAGIEAVGPQESAPTRDLLRVEPVGGEERGGGSSWQSLARGAGSIESDYLNGEIVLLGRLHGVPTPVNATLQHLATASARERKAPGSITVAELTALVDAA